MNDKIIKILIIGENQNDLTALKKLIENINSNSTVLIVNNIETVVGIAIFEKPDIIIINLLDIEIDCFLLCNKLKSNSLLNIIPIVFIINDQTGKESRKRAVRCNIDGFLSQPFDESELTVLLQSMIKIKDVNLYKQNKKYHFDRYDEIQTQEHQLLNSVTQYLPGNVIKELTEKYNVELERKSDVLYNLQNILSPEGSIADLELHDIIDISDIQNLMENFYELSMIPMTITDIKGNILVGVGWQDICTKFHRVKQESCANCRESDVYLTKGIPEGEFRMYKCKNNMWDIATPIIIGQEHKGNLFIGQFFFDDEPVDETFFRHQAKKFGYDEQAYIEAIEKAPRISKKKLDHAKDFFLNLSRSISQLSFSNILLARAISRQTIIEEALRESEELLNKAQEIAHLGSWSLDLITNQLTWSYEMYRIFGIEPQEFTATYEGFLGAIHPDDREKVNSAYLNSINEGKDGYMVEHRIINKNSGELHYVFEKCQHIKDENDTIVRSIGMMHDISSRKIEEERLRKMNRSLAALSKSSQAMSQSINEEDYLKQVCKIVVEDAEFTMVWIGFAQNDEAKTVKPVSSAGFEDNYLESINVTWDDSDTGHGPTGTAIRTGQICLCNNIHTDPAFEPWREKAIKRGYAASIVFPLKSGDYTFGAISIYSKEPNCFHEEEINLLSELAKDLAHGITTIRLRTAHQLAEKELNKSHGELELLVKERTRELEISNELLQKEINISKQQEINLKLAEEKYRTVADYTYGWEFWLDNDESFLYCSPSCERITGYKASEFLNNSNLLYDIIHPDDLNIFLSHRRLKELSHIKESELEYRIVRPDGSIRWIGHACQPITNEFGVHKGVRGSNKDITRRKEMQQLLKTSNQKYRLLSANITDGIFICKNGKLDYVNKSMKRIFGYNKTKMEGLLLNQLALPDYQDKLNKILDIH